MGGLIFAFVAFFFLLGLLSNYEQFKPLVIMTIIALAIYMIL